jgi:hypothetical protein
MGKSTTQNICQAPLSKCRPLGLLPPPSCSACWNTALRSLPEKESQEVHDIGRVAEIVTCDAAAVYIVVRTSNEEQHVA